MLAVILTILKIIGIVLLCVLGLALVLLLLVLILPVKFRISAVKHGEEALNAHFKLTYFLRLFRVFADYDGKLILRAKVLWFTIFKLEYPDEDKVSDDDAELDELLQQMDEEYESEFPEDEISSDDIEAENENAEEATEDSVNDVQESSEDLTEPDQSFEDTEDVTESDAEDSGTPEDDTVKEAENTEEDEPRDFFSKIKYKYRAICDKIESARSEYRYYRNVINSNEAHYALRCVKKALKKIFKAVLPRKIYANVTYGFSSPDITGKVYGLYCLIKKRFEKGSVVTPDFDREVFDGEVRAVGHFSLITIVNAGICVIANGNVRKIYRSFKKHNSKVGKGNSNG